MMTASINGSHASPVQGLTAEGAPPFFEGLGGRAVYAPGASPVLHADPQRVQTNPLKLENIAAW